MTRDRLYVLETRYADPALGGVREFYCKDCITVEGLLAAFPAQAAGVEVVRVAWPRPRAAVVGVLGEDDQNLPALAFTEGGHVNDLPTLLAALHQRHGFPEPHP